jgi:hypothetical protein
MRWESIRILRKNGDPAFAEPQCTMSVLLRFSKKSGFRGCFLGADLAKGTWDEHYVYDVHRAVIVQVCGGV